MEIRQLHPVKPVAAGESRYLDIASNMADGSQGDRADSVAGDAD